MINLYDTASGLFDVLGKFLKAAADQNTARGTTFPASVQDALDVYKLWPPTLNTEAAFSGVAQTLQQLQSAAGVNIAGIQDFCATLIMEAVAADSPQPRRSIDLALEYLIRDMVAQGYYVDSSASGVTLTAGAGNSSTDLYIANTIIRGDGTASAFCKEENLSITVQNEQRELSTSLLFEGVAQVDSLLPEWPAGSGASIGIAATDPADSLIPNGDFEDEDATVANLPNGWIAAVGTPGTHFALTSVEVQTITRSGTASSGWWAVKWADPEGETYQTVPLAYNAEGSAVSAAIAALPGLEAISVSTSGTSPDLTHVITFNGTAGNINTVTIVNNTNGTISAAQTTAGSANSYRGRSFTLIGNGSTLTAHYVQIPLLEPEKVYFLMWRHRKSGTPAAGVVRVSIKQGIGGSVILNSLPASMELSLTLTGSPVGTSFTGYDFAVQINKSQKQPLFLCLEQTTAISNGTTFAIDDLALVEGVQLYPGGPFVAALGGLKGAYKSDSWTLEVTNDRGGSVQEWFERFFGLSQLGLQLPITGSTNIPDSVIS